MHAIITVRVIENNEIDSAIERTIFTVPLHDCKNGISVLYHVIVNSQLDSDNSTRCLII